MGTQKIHVNLSDHAKKDLDKLASDNGMTMTDVVRLGLGLAKIAVVAKRAGNSIAVVDSRGKVLKEVMLPE